MTIPRPLSNPVLRREARVRWRGWAAHIVVLLYASLLAGAVVWRYNVFQHDGAIIKSATLGRQLFELLTFFQTVGWLLIAPVLTASAIAGERERGTLLSLQLSHLSPREMAWGKWLSALGFIALLLVAPLPVVAMCFLLGGVAPWEFGVAFALHASIACAGSAIGLACSSRQARTSGAIASGLGLVALWSLLPPFSLIGPIAATAALLSGPTPPIGIALGCLALTASALFCRAMLRETARALLRPMAVEEAPSKLAPAAFERATVEEEPKAHPLGDWKRLPLVNALQLSNPVLARETRVRLQVREGSLGTRGHTPSGCIWTLGLFFACFAVLVRVEQSSRDACWLIFSNVWLVAVFVAAPILGAGAITREREAGMWESLRLSLLSRGEIVGGKIGAAFVVCGYYSLALLPVLLPCIDSVWADSRAGVSLPRALLTLLLVAAVCWSGVCCGVFCSWFCRQTWVATSLALAATFVLLTVPLLFNVGVGLNPFAMLQLLRNSPAGAALPAVLGCVVLWTLGGAGLLLVVWRQMRREAGR